MAKGSVREMTIEDWRRKIDEIDRKLVELMNERSKCAIEIGKIKRAQNLRVHDPERVQEILQRIKETNSGPLDSPGLQRLFERFDISALLNDPLKQTLQPRTVERSGVRFFDPLENFLFPFRIIDRQILGALDLSDFNGAFRTLVQQLNKLPVDLINFPPPIFDGHFPDGSFSHLANADTVPTRSTTSGSPMTFSISLTMALPTIAASASRHTA